MLAMMPTNGWVPALPRTQATRQYGALELRAVYATVITLPPEKGMVSCW
jgi:hypothetical protein